MFDNAKIKMCVSLCLFSLFEHNVHNVLSLVSSTNKTDHYDITEILLKVALDTLNQPPII